MVPPASGTARPVSGAISGRDLHGAAFGTSVRRHEVAQRSRRALSCRLVFAFLTSLSGQEMFLLFLIGLLLYGRNLPEAGRNLGRVVAQLKRSFHDFKDQLDKEGDIREVKKVISDTAREVKNVSRIPTAMQNPASALRELSHQAMSEPLPDDEPDEPPSAPDAAAGAPAANGHPANETTQPKP